MANRPDDVELPQRGYNTEDIRTVTGKPKRRRWGRWLLTILVLVPLVVIGVWLAATLGVSYSRGERAGIIQKFSRKGWICKTWEGELAMATIPGAVPEKFEFTVRDDSVAALINTLYRQGMRTSLIYEEHRGVPTTCFGETPYYVTGAQVIGGQGAVPSATGATVPGALAPAGPGTAAPTAPAGAVPKAAPGTAAPAPSTTPSPAPSAPPPATPPAGR